jgi:hypothetical protein
MDSDSTVLLITSIVTTLILGVLIAVTFSMLMTSKAINRRLDELDEHLLDLVTVMDKLSESSQAELSELHSTLAEQQRVHQSIRATSRLIDIVFRKPAVTTAAAAHTASKQRLRRKNRKNVKVDA